MPSQENHEHSAPTTNHHNGEGSSHSARDIRTGNSMGGGRGRGRGSSNGFGSRNRGNGGGRHKKKDIGRAEWAYVD